MSIKLVQLNVQKNLHFDRIIPFLKKEDPDVVCLQEFREENISLFERELNMKSFYNCRVESSSTDWIKASDLEEGMVIFTKHSLKETGKFVYIGVDKFKVLNNIVIFGVVQVGGVEYNIFNTHFVWTPDGHHSEAQIEASKNLREYLEKYDSFFFCGDFNAPRGRKIFTYFTEFMKDNVPEEIDSTIDLKYHRVKDLIRMVDGLFSKGDHVVSNVRMVDGLSDHKGFVCEISRK